MSSERNDRARRSPFHSLTFRLNAWYAGFMVVGLAALGVLAFLTLRRGMERDHLVFVEARLERHRVVLNHAGLLRFERAVEQAESLEGDHGPVRVRDGAGQTLFQHGDPDHAPGLISTTANDDLKLEIGPTDPPWAHLGPHVTEALLVFLVGFLLLGVGGGVYLTRSALRPVSALAGTARAVIDSGDLSRRVEVRKSRNELDELARLVNGMLDRNQTLVKGMREALDNVAHDLRTPLTRLRGVAEVALGSADEGASREALADCIEEADRALVMLRTLMDISEAEAGIMRLDLRAVDVRALARETVDLYAHVADEAGVTLSLDTGDPVTAWADSNRLRQALANLVDNAIKYTGRGGAVEILVDRNGVPNSEVKIHVRDTGRGIPAEALPRIWDRLYRVDPSRSQRGLGLGLSLVKAIALAHNGRVTVASEPGHGSTFTLTLPRSRAAGDRLSQGTGVDTGGYVDAGCRYGHD